MAVDEPPIAFGVEPPAELAGPTGPGSATRLTTRARALAGMQKEAIVDGGPGRPCWRLLCDEGPWLNGTDLAPFPLGYFAAGLASCFVADIVAEAAARAAVLDRLELDLDVFFTMEGSVLRGTMAAGVDSIRLTAYAGRPDSDGEFATLLDGALGRRSAAHRALRGRLPSRFRLTVNGQHVDWPGERTAALARAADPQTAFDHVRPIPHAELPAPLVRKASGAGAAAAGPAVGLQSEQKRTVHIHADARLRPEGLAECAVHCVQPPGSRFVFLSELGPATDAAARAPGGYVYLSAGIAFCFMTQLGRYAQIRKLALDGYRIVQETAFGPEGPAPVETAVFLDSGDSIANNLEMVRMGERTCYLHTAFREPVRVDCRPRAVELDHHPAF